MATTEPLPAPSVPSELPFAGVLAVAFAGFATFLDLYATQPLLPHFVDIFHTSKAMVGLTVSAPTAAVALFAPIFGLFGDRVSRKRVMVTSMFILSISTFLAATAHSLVTLIFWRFLQGAATPGVYVIALAYLSEEAGPASVGRAMSAFVTGNVIGGFAGRALTGYIADRFDWPPAFVLLGVLNVIGAAVVWTWLPPSRNFTPIAARSAEAESIGSRVTRLLTPRLLATLAIGFNVLFSLVASFSYVVFHLAASPFHLTGATLSLVFSVYLIGAVVTPISGRLIDRAGAQRVLMVSLLVGAAGMMLTLLPSLAAVVTGLALACSSAFVCQSASTTQLRSAAPAGLRSLASGAYVTCYYLGGSAGGVAPGLAWKHAGWAGCVALVVVVELSTIAIASYFWRDSKSPPITPLPPLPSAPTV